jgi:FKBP-type peptidyl-prolyl cis-trans isomerase
MVYSNKMKFLFIGFTIAVINSCSDQKLEPGKIPTQQQINSSMEEYNRQFARDESVQIVSYIERRGWEMQSTGTGLRYMIYEMKDSPIAKMGDLVEIEYEVSLLNGDVLYSSEESGSRSLEIGKANIESGLHEGLLLMKIGERAKFILPSHLAHGLSGDNEKIPPRSSVVYDIKLLNKK